MNTPRLPCRAAAGIATTAGICEAANLASQEYGIPAGAAVIAVVFAACWIIRNVRPLLHPAQPVRKCDPLVPAGNASADSGLHDMLPVL